MRGAAVGLDPWPILRMHRDDLAIAREMIASLEENELAKVTAQANETAFKTVNGIVDVLEVLGFVERKR